MALFMYIHFSVTYNMNIEDILHLNYFTKNNNREMNDTND